MALKLHELSPALRQRIEAQIAAEDRALGKLEASQPKPTLAPALVSCQPKPKEGEECVHAGIILIAFRRRLLDGDNNVASFKPLQDAIAASLNLDDADPRLSWQYGQQQTKESEGVIVIIEEL